MEAVAGAVRRSKSAWWARTSSPLAHLACACVCACVVLVCPLTGKFIATFLYHFAVQQGEFEENPQPRVICTRQPFIDQFPFDHLNHKMTSRRLWVAVAAGTAGGVATYRSNAARMEAAVPLPPSTKSVALTCSLLNPVCIGLADFFRLRGVPEVKVVLANPLTGSAIHAGICVSLLSGTRQQNVLAGRVGENV